MKNQCLSNYVFVMWVVIVIWGWPIFHTPSCSPFDFPGRRGAWENVFVTYAAMSFRPETIKRKSFEFWQTAYSAILWECEQVWSELRSHMIWCPMWNRASNGRIDLNASNSNEFKFWNGSIVWMFIVMELHPQLCVFLLISFTTQYTSKVETGKENICWR